MLYQPTCPSPKGEGFTDPQGGTLKNAGTVILSGDLFHSYENRAHRRMPVFNVSRADTLASIDRIEAIAKNTGAKVVIQHSVESFNTLPKFPAYLD
jgi:N-acyl homoserine lactone hydrolase